MDRPSQQARTGAVARSNALHPRTLHDTMLRANHKGYVATLGMTIPPSLMVTATVDTAFQWEHES